MRKVVVQQFVTLDGYAAGPSGELDFVSEAGSAADPHRALFVERQLAFIESLDTILLGAVTYRMFAAYWPEQTTETQAIADALNATPKVVFSSTLESAPWGVLGACAAGFRQRRGGGSPAEGRALGRTWSSGEASPSRTPSCDKGLVDEYRLQVCPVVLGRGKRLFEDGLFTSWLTRLETNTYDDMVAVRYASQAELTRASGEKPAIPAPSKSPLTDSNRRPPPYHGGALPTELRGRCAHRSGGFRWA